jgi:hypothetical protein
MPRPTAAQAAMLAAAAVERMSHGRRMGSGTTFSRSAAAVVRIRSRRRAGGGGDTTASASAAAVSPRLAEPRKPHEHAALDRAQRLPEPLARCWSGSFRSASCTRSRCSRS